MATRLNIQADIVDVSTDRPQKSDIFLVDTNVWLWQTYSRLSSSDFSRFADPNPVAARSKAQKARDKVRKYVPYIRESLLAEATLVYSGLILAELTHIIEKTEYEIYKNRNGVRLDIKEYRHSRPDERANVIAEVQLVWSQVESIGISANLTIDDRSTQSALSRLQTQSLDGYDLFLLEAISHAGSEQIQVLTDDMDYATVAGIQVFTSNGLVIEEAKRLDKLLVR